MSTLLSLASWTNFSELRGIGSFRRRARAKIMESASFRAVFTIPIASRKSVLKLVQLLLD